MSLTKVPKRHYFPISVISQAVWLYHRFNHSFRDVQEQLAFRDIIVSHETIRSCCNKFSKHFGDVIGKRKRKPCDKWHLDEMMIKINGEPFILWHAVDAEGYELDVFLQKRRNKKSAIRFLSRLLRNDPAPRIMVTNKLRSYIKPIKFMFPNTEHRSHRGLNNCVENAHQPTRRKEKYLIKFKSPKGVQSVLSLMGKVRNLFTMAVGRYTKLALQRREAFEAAKTLWGRQLKCLLSKILNYKLKSNYSMIT